MNLRQLHYFRTVVEQGSMGAASEVLHIAQPPLSVAIKQLEGEWNVSLFERTGRGLVVTDTGIELYERVCELLNHASRIEEEMAALGRGAKGRVRIGFVAAGMDVAARTVAALRAELPLVTFSLHQGEPRLLEEMIERRALDFALTQLPVANPALAVKPLMELHFVALVRRDDARFSPGGELVEGGDVTFAELASMPLVVLRRSSGRGIYERVLDEFRAAGAEANIVADSSDVPAIAALVQHGVGIGIVPTARFGDLHNALETRRIVTQGAAESVALIHGMGRRFLPVVQRAIAACMALGAKRSDRC
jgi:LysR family transcriptional regulator, salicylic acid-responsive activator of bsdBCD